MQQRGFGLGMNLGGISHGYDTVKLDQNSGAFAFKSHNVQQRGSVPGTGYKVKEILGLDKSKTATAQPGSRRHLTSIGKDSLNESTHKDPDTMKIRAGKHTMTASF